MRTTGNSNAGQLDPAFGTLGRLNLPDTFSGGVTSVLAGPEGTFFVAGTSVHRNESGDVIATEYVIAKFSGDGVLDTRFGVGGVVVGNFAPGTNAANYATLFTQGDHLLVCGKDGYNKSVAFAAARLTLQGQLDKTFGNNGVCLFPLEDIVGETKAELHFTVMSAMADDGKILLAAGLYYPDGAYHPIVVRLTAEGALDRSWDGRGYKVIVVEQPGALFSRLYGLHADGQKIIVSANYDAPHNATSDKNYMARFEVDGSIDRSFGVDGLFLFPPVPERVSPMGVDGEFFPFSATSEVADDKVWPLLRIVSSGTTGAAPHYLATGTKFRENPRKWAGIIIGLDEGGQYDRHFNDGKAVIVDPDAEGAYINQCIVQAGSDAFIIAVGSRETGTLISRYTPDGKLDRAFGNEGYVILVRNGAYLPILTTFPAIIRTPSYQRLLINFWDEEGRPVIEAYTL